MSDTAIASDTDRRPWIVVCAYDPGETRWDPMQDLSGIPWGPAGARTRIVDAGDPQRLSLDLRAEMSDRRCRAVLLLGRNRDRDGFGLQLRVEHDDGAVPVRSPSVQRSTVPAAEILRTLRAEGMTAEGRSEAENDDGDRLLHTLLASVRDGDDLPSIGLLRLPAEADAATVTRAVKTTISVMARHLAPLPRHQPA